MLGGSAASAAASASTMTVSSQGIGTPSGISGSGPAGGEPPMGEGTAREMARLSNSATCAASSASSMPGSSSPDFNARPVNPNTKSSTRRHRKKRMFSLQVVFSPQGTLRIWVSACVKKGRVVRRRLARRATHQEIHHVHGEHPAVVGVRLGREVGEADDLPRATCMNAGASRCSHSIRLQLKVVEELAEIILRSG